MSSAQHQLLRRDARLPAPAYEAVEGDWTVPVLRELVEVSTDDGVRLVALRKRPLDQARTRGSVLLVHGLCQNRYTWDMRQRSLANYLVAHGYDVLLAELRGHGLSRASRAPYASSFEAYIRHDLPALVRKAAALGGSERIFLVGHSLGGTMAYCAGTALQPYLRGIVSFAGPSHLGRGSLFIPPLAAALHWMGRVSPVPAWRSLPYIGLDLLGPLLLAARPYLDSPLSFRPLGLWYPRSIEAPLLEERIRLGFDRTGVPIGELVVRWAATGRLLSSCGTVDYQDGLAGLEVPVLFLVGAQDAVVPTRSMQAAFEQIGSRDKTFRVFGRTPLSRGWGHIDIVLGKAAPRVVWPALLDWMAQH
jgi:alpha-beta hydrolase superfamily lysophospholipase